MTHKYLSETLHRLMHAYRRQLTEGINRQNISLPVSHIRALKVLCRLPDSSARTVAQHLSRDKAQITRIVNKLVELRLIKRVANPVDQRSQLLLPTASGRKVIEKIDALEVQVAQTMTQGLSKADVDAFRRISATMIDNASAMRPEAQEQN